jgi:hypothetical protein
MKKILLVLMMICTLSIYSQGLERDKEWESVFTYYDLDVQAWKVGDNLIVSDSSSLDLYDIQDTLSTILFSIVDESEFQGVGIDELLGSVESIKYTVSGIEWSLEIDREMIIRYLNTKDKDRKIMIKDLVDKNI